MKLRISTIKEDKDPVNHSVTLEVTLPWDADKDQYLDAYAAFLRAVTFEVGELVDTRDQ